MGIRQRAEGATVLTRFEFAATRPALLIIAAGAGLLISCVTPEPATIGYPPPPAEAIAAAQPFCRLTIHRVTDLRRDRTTLGIVGGRVIRAPSNSEDWIRHHLARLRDDGVTVTFAAPAADETTPAMSAEVQLMTAWAESVASSRTATVIVAVRYDRAGAFAKQVSYRGSVTEINWWNSGAEMQAMIDACLSQILVAMRHELSILCKQGA